MRIDSASESKGKKRNKYNASEAGPRSEERIKNIKEKKIINYFNRLNYLEIMKKYLLFATAALALASCTNESYLGTAEELATTKGEQPISFGSGLNAITRADKTGAEAATDLNGKFYVWGIKKEGGTGGDGINEASSGNLVYSNYVVEWTDNSAMTTTSNTKGWEYVGKTLSAAEQACITASGSTNPDNGGSAVQTIKYWDWGAADYTFYAFTADPADFATSSAKITVVKTESVTSPATVYDKGYVLTIAEGANLDKLYFAERVNITKSSNTERTVPNQYGGNVTFRFHNTATKVRVAMYETIPGYSVTINKFSVDNDGANPEFAAMTDDVTANFAANLQYSPKGVAGTMTVTYDSNVGTATHNWPVVDFTPTSGKAKVLALGTGLKADVTLGESVGAATYDKTDNPATPGVDESYTSVYPNETNTQNMKVKLSYTLTAPVTGETIVVTNATAEIPAAYLKWKPGFAYTYIFKISDNTNGYTDPSAVDPAGLYPITFDAVEMLADDGSAEYITTVSEPSITTFGVNSTTGKYVTGGNEYAAGSDIYATIMDGSAVVTPVFGTNVNLYKNVQSSNATDFPVTEASLAEAIAETGGSAGEKITYTLDNTIGVVRSGADEANGIPGEDDIVITGVPAVKMAGLTAGTYAVEYIKTPEVFTAVGYTYASAAEFAAAGTLYTTAACTTVADTWANSTTTYYKKVVNMPGNKVYKIIVVQ